MSISRYIVVAVVRCSRASYLLAGALLQLTEAEVAVGDERTRSDLLGDGEGFPVCLRSPAELDWSGAGVEPRRSRRYARHVARRN